MTRRRRKPGEGSVTKERGRFRVRLTTASGERVGGTVDTELDAEGLRIAMREQLAESHMDAAGGMTLRAWAPEFFARRERDGGRDIYNERKAWEFLVEKAHFIDWPIRRIKTRDVLRWRDEMQARDATSARSGQSLGRKLSRKRIQIVLGLLRGALREAVDYGHADSNVAADVRVKRVARVQQHPDALSREEQERLIAAARADASKRTGPEYLILEFLMGTGLRPSEAASLRLVDVHIEGDASSYIEIIYGKENLPPKVGKPGRVGLFGIALEAAQKWLQVLPEYARVNPHGLMFPNRTGTRRRTKNGHPFFKNSWERWLLAAKLLPHQRQGEGHGRRPTLYVSTRHTFATSLLNGSWGKAWRMEDTAAMCRHADMAMTQRHYAHVTKDRLLELAQEAQTQFKPLALRPVPGDAPRTRVDTGATTILRPSEPLGSERDTGLEPATNATTRLVFGWFV